MLGITPCSAPSGRFFADAFAFDKTRAPTGEVALASVRSLRPSLGRPPHQSPAPAQLGSPPNKSARCVARSAAPAAPPARGDAPHSAGQGGEPRGGAAAGSQRALWAERDAVGHFELTYMYVCLYVVCMNVCMFIYLRQRIYIHEI
jgi:hypothetical protein